MYIQTGSFFRKCGYESIELTAWEPEGAVWCQLKYPPNIGIYYLIELPASFSFLNKNENQRTSGFNYLKTLIQRLPVLIFKN
jgi:hypothetical protein